VAAPINYTGGVGGSVGAELATLTSLLLNGNIWYVNSTGGSDAASPRGQDRARPLATLAQANTNAADGDIIVCLSGHTETLSGAVALKGVTLVGEGQGSSRPRFARTGAVSVFTVATAGTRIDNIYFPATASGSVSTTRLSVGASECTVNNCYFEAGASDTGPALTLAAGASSASIFDTTFISTATSTAAQPASAISVTSAINDLTIDGLTLSGGTTGWSAVAAWITSAAITRLRATNVDLLLDSDVQFTSNTTGYLHVRYKSGSARVTWP
jgi:hypothetical protein